jgi:ATP/ADP translocase
MSDRLMFLLFAIVLFPLGTYALVNPRGAKKWNADGPYFKSGVANMPLWFFRVGGVVTVGMSAFLYICF